MCSKILSIVNAAALSFQQNYHLYSINLCIFNSKNSDHSVEVKKKNPTVILGKKRGWGVDKILKGWYIINGILLIFGIGVDGMINKKNLLLQWKKKLNFDKVCWMTQSAILFKCEQNNDWEKSSFLNEWWNKLK